MKNETKAIIILSCLLLANIITTIVLFRTSSSSYQERIDEITELYNKSETTNNELRAGLERVEELQQQLQSVKLKYEELEREREETLARREGLEQVASELNYLIGERINETQGRVEEVRGTIGAVEEIIDRLLQGN
jgi:uncharacterized coiled-coil DUF342 family protein